MTNPRTDDAAIASIPSFAEPPHARALWKKGKCLPLLDDLDPILRRAARPIPKNEMGDKSHPVHQLAVDMVTTMHTHNGIGLAAPQVGHSVRMIVVWDPDRQRDVIMVNPAITRSGGKRLGEEGCLSLPGWRVLKERANKVTVNYVDLDGHVQSLTCTHLMAACVQHEIDHLNGVLMTDATTKTKIIAKP